MKMILNKSNNFFRLIKNFNIKREITIFRRLVTTSKRNYVTSTDVQEGDKINIRLICSNVLISMANPTKLLLKMQW